MNLYYLLRRSIALAASCAFASLVVAQTTTVLDDFSTDLRSTSYTFKSGNDARWRVFNGVLDPTSGSTTELYSSWIWSGGESLHAIGDSFSIDLQLIRSGSGFNGGLAVWKSNSANSDPSFDRVFEPRLTGPSLTDFEFMSEANNPQGYVITTLPNTGSLSPIATTLTVTLTNRTASDSTLTAVLSGSGFDTITHTYISDFTGDFFVGPSTYQADGINVSFDNLTYTGTSAVPEPSTYAAIFGSAVLGLAIWRRRRSTKPGLS